MLSFSSIIVSGDVCQLLLGLDPAQAVVTNIDQLTPLHETRPTSCCIFSRVGPWLQPATYYDPCLWWRLDISGNNDYWLLVITVICTAITNKYMLARPRSSLPEVVWNTSSLRVFICVGPFRIFKCVRIMWGWLSRSSGVLGQKGHLAECGAKSGLGGRGCWVELGAGSKGWFG